MPLTPAARARSRERGRRVTERALIIALVNGIGSVSTPLWFGKMNRAIQRQSSKFHKGISVRVKIPNTFADLITGR